jgi:hypothetical protein
MNWHECRDCGHVFTEGYFEANATPIVFAKTQPNQTVGYDMEPQRPVPKPAASQRPSGMRRATRAWDGLPIPVA